MATSEVDALSALLTLWREAPNAQLADRIVALGALSELEVDAESWLAVAQGRRPEALSPLLRVAVRCRSARLRERLEALLGFDADPRLDRFVAGLYARPPVKRAGPLWEAVRSLASRVRDVRALESLRATHAAPAGDAEWSGFVRAQLDRVFLDVWAVEDAPLSPALDARLAELDATVLARAAGQPPPWEAAEAAFLADPTNEHLRAVLRDVLLETNHPRGRLMLLQEAGEDGAELVKAHAAELLGPLAKVLKPGCVFAQGWLCIAALKQGVADASRLARDATAGAPLWATVTHLIGPGDGRIATHPVMKSLRALSRSELGVAQLNALKLERLLDYDLRREEAILFADPGVLPHLTALHVRLAANDVELLLERARSLRSLRVDVLDATPRSSPRLVARLAELRLDEVVLGFLPGPQRRPRLLCELRHEEGHFDVKISRNAEGATTAEEAQLRDGADALTRELTRLGVITG